MAYSLDIDAKNPLNVVVSKHRRIDGTWFFTPPGGAFFTVDLVVRDTLGNKELTPLVQYRAIELEPEATKMSNKEVMMALVIMDDSVSEVEVTRRVIGGEFENIDISTIITDDDIEAINSTIWGQNVTGRPLLYPPEPHGMFEFQIIGLNPVAYLLDEISEALTNGSKHGWGMMYQYIDRITNEVNTNLENRIDNIDKVINEAKENAKLPLNIVIATSRVGFDPAKEFKYGKWRRVEGLLMGVAKDVDIGMRRKVGEGTDHLMTGIVYWELYSY